MKDAIVNNLKRLKNQIIISTILIMVPMLAGFCLWNQLPDQLVTHFGASGTPDGISSKLFTVVGLPLVIYALQWIGLIGTMLDPKNREQTTKGLSVILWIFPMISLLLMTTVYLISMGKGVSIISIIQLIFGLMFIIIGNYMPKCKQNMTIGIKVTWTLHNEENWNRTHRFAGKFWVACGILFLIAFAFPVDWMIVVFFVAAMLAVFVPVIYSYWYYRQQLKAGTATKEEMKMSKYEKVCTWIVLVAVIFSLIPVIYALNKSNYEVNYGAESFIIDASSWDDIEIRYADIDNITYRESQPEGAVRVYGFGSFNLIMGVCESEEMGQFTMYSHTDSAPCIVLEVQGEKLVINGEDHFETEEMFDTIFAKMLDAK